MNPNTQNDEPLRVQSGAPWETKFGYCRALRLGPIIEVAGTTAMKDGDVVGVGDPYLQTKEIFRIIQDALQKLGSSVDDIIRTRIYVTQVSQWPEIARAHQEIFAEIRPVASLVEVSALIDPRLLVEVEAHAIARDSRS